MTSQLTKLFLFPSHEVCQNEYVYILYKQKST